MSYNTFLLFFCFTRDNGHPSTSWYNKGWTPSTNKDQSTKSSYTGWSKRCTRENPSEYEGRHNYWDDGKAQDYAHDTEGVATEGKARGKEKGTAVWDRAGTNERVPEQEGETDFVVTKERLWDVHSLEQREGEP